jgi:DMSO/TMAO reductase YedYZ molybdopterin-dependent catalytic subunit
MAAASASLAGPAYAGGIQARTVLSVNGEVTTPAAYTAAELATLPQTTVSVTVGSRTVTDTGVLLETSC